MQIRHSCAGQPKRPMLSYRLPASGHFENLDQEYKIIHKILRSIYYTNYMVVPLPKTYSNATSGPTTGQAGYVMFSVFPFFPFLLRPFLSRLLEPFVLTRSSNR